MAHREDASVYAVKSSRGQPPIDRSVAKPEMEELLSPDDAVLPRRKLSDEPVDWASLSFAADIAVNLKCGAHGADDGARRRARGAQNVELLQLRAAPGLREAARELVR
jgi:hypothetical protein